jgi:hypothetical protein
LLWFVLETIRLRPDIELEKAIGIPEDFEPLLGVAVGHATKPVTTHPTNKEKIAVTIT